ncbi:divalent-cation tolerance protein CutA [Nocardia farcinica]|uniref:Divalent-cation tolerance protein CutA n=1 Tax=Nocardia farcinica TaxID=37329 RepID=A0A0H5P2M1_NOCFR|nr:divalent-cation tolerance protein CutA [Nocardia farcinica]AXK87548.1 divalent-cation tolerance protein CutA [Nocardia farcinica]MBA4857427.1 divalent-cation tolerance protein CutA [Nocardia farcinica]MBC9816871.1 divalent-cation tolerance protein CutA [Nocardia farcinica]MBF6071099.1 divalent-cation tolerance protein CutA [Nocardia farcinica]MBF6521284.1 divalent-cation tolerance protein CutA [Nocardia farcinica]
MTEEIVDVSVTAESAEWLAEFTRGLVRDRLAACGNIVSGVRSIYRWEGALCDDTEALVVLHTRRSLVPAILDRARAEHPATTPQVLAVPVVEAHPGYRQWVLDSTARPDA